MVFRRQGVVRVRLAASAVRPPFGDGAVHTPQASDRLVEDQECCGIRRIVRRKPAMLVVAYRETHVLLKEIADAALDGTRKH
jgi:hypothetical protein